MDNFVKFFRYGLIALLALFALQFTGCGDPAPPQDEQIQAENIGAIVPKGTLADYGEFGRVVFTNTTSQTFTLPALGCNGNVAWQVYIDTIIGSSAVRLRWQGSNFKNAPDAKWKTFKNTVYAITGADSMIIYEAPCDTFTYHRLIASLGASGSNGLAAGWKTTHNDY